MPALTPRRPKKPKPPVHDDRVEREMTVRLSASDRAYLVAHFTKLRDRAVDGGGTWQFWERMRREFTR
jgi:hypothetical protein